MFRIGIDVGGMSIKGGIVDDSGNILFKSVEETKKYDENYCISMDIKTVIDDLLDLSNLKINEIRGIGIGQPGIVDPDKGIIKYSNNIALHNVRVVDKLKWRYNTVIKMDNDANCAVLGERAFGAAKGSSDVLLVTLGTGVGTGIIVKDQLLSCAEGGHMTIRLNGLPCNCGKKGCWETYASVTGLISQTKAAMAKRPFSLMSEIAEKEGKVNGKVAFAASRQDDLTAIKVVKQYITYVSEGIVNLVNLFRPDIILIGGAISKEGEYLTAPIQAYVNKHNFGARYNKKIKVVPASLTNDAGILGAAALIDLPINK